MKIERTPSIRLTDTLWWLAICFAMGFFTPLQFAMGFAAGGCFVRLLMDLEVLKDKEDV